VPAATAAETYIMFFQETLRANVLEITVSKRWISCRTTFIYIWLQCCDANSYSHPTFNAHFGRYVLFFWAVFGDFLLLGAKKAAVFRGWPYVSGHIRGGLITKTKKEKIGGKSISRIWRVAVIQGALFEGFYCINLI